jgi:hypothetical protein
VAPEGKCRQKWRSWGTFLGLNALLLAVFFWPALTGSALLAPLDIPSNLFSKYRYLDPSADGVPKNHYPIDLIIGDLPRNVLVHEAWQRGEFPWWDPFTHRGRPLAAEANAVNASDPVKFLIYRLLPFEAAYNWARVVPFFISGLTMFLLLRRLGVRGSFATWGALLYEFAGCNFVMFSGPMVQATFAYYPLLWMLWHCAVEKKGAFWFLVSAPVVALIFLSGNLQSHAYLPFFGLAFLISYGWKQMAQWRHIVPGLACAGILGLALAAPFVWPQVELYQTCERELPPPLSWRAYLSGVASLSALFPWSLGTFRTLDASKLFGQSLLGFWIYIGSAALVIAALGARRSPAETERGAAARMALALVALYLVVCSTPLLRVLYVRTAWLGVLGLVVLLARGLVFLRDQNGARKSWAVGVLFASGLLAGVFNVGAAWLYPKVQPQVEARFLEAQRTSPTLDAAEPLRRFQVRNFLNEVTFKNPETALALGSMVALGIFLWRPPQARTAALHGILILSTLPLLLFGHRFVPMHRIELWKQLRAGGPEHQRVLAQLRPFDRLAETAPGMHETLFPGAMSQLYRAHVVHGYSSFIFAKAANLPATAPASWLFDREYIVKERGQAQGEWRVPNHTNWSRARWGDGSPRPILATSESLNTLVLGFDSGEAADLIRTDTFYPGWRAFAGGTELPVQLEPPIFSRVRVPAGATEVRFTYQPRFWRVSLWIAGAAGLLLMASLVIFHPRRLAP